MARSYYSVVSSILPALCAGIGFTPGMPAQAQSPVAYVYVSSQPANDVHRLYGFSTTPDGRLTPIPGMPFTADLANLSLNGAWLFGVGATPNTGSANTVDSYSISGNGLLRLQSSLSLPALEEGIGTTTFLDHTGATLYVGTDVSDNGGYQPLQINQSTGQLTPVGSQTPSVLYIVPLSFIGNNLHAYGADTYEFAGGVFGMARQIDGALTPVGLTGAPPAPQGQYYAPYSTAADPSNHVVVGMLPFDASTNAPTGPERLAVYTADSSGNLSTTSTYQNMPATQVVTTDSQNTRFLSTAQFAMSPDGTYLAVAGNHGAELFLMHGANPPTAIPGAHLLGVDVEQIFWDNSNHLYAISNGVQALAVFNVTAQNGGLAPGSPYPIQAPTSLIVLPK